MRLRHLFVDEMVISRNIFMQVFQGLLRSRKDFQDTKPSMTRLWVHECFRYVRKYVKGFPSLHVLM